VFKSVYRVLHTHTNTPEFAVSADCSKSARKQRPFNTQSNAVQQFKFSSKRPQPI